ncbi:hypothetical protein ACHAQA_006172 [Verticillium albo-atrum]
MDVEADKKHMASDKAASLQTQDHTTSVETTRRGLSPRHVQLMAIASGIGVGLFIGIGGVLRSAGPLPLLMGYLIYGLGFIWPVSVNVAEMLSWLPIRGTIYELADRFVDPALGFAMGWTYFFATTMLVCTEYSAVATVAQYWTTDVNPAVWVLMCMVICYFLNMVAVRWFGETEFLMGSTKIMLLFGLILATFITMVGGNPRNDAYGFRNWANGDFAHPYYTTGGTGYLLSLCVSVRYAVFTVGGPDVLSITAGEIRNPRSTLPRVAKMIAVRIITFYVLGVLAVGILCNSNNPRLLGAIESGSAGAAASPWVLGLLEVGISGFLPDLINALILMSGLSCGNAYLYSSSRALYSMAQNGKAPKILAKCTKAGVPWVAVTTVTVISFLTFLTASNQASEVFTWFLELTTVSIVVNNTCMAVVFIAWSRALKIQGFPRRGQNTLKKSWMDKLTLPKEVRDTPADAEGIIFPYIARCATWTPYTSVAFGTTIALFIGFDMFHPFSVRGFITCYFGLAWFVVLFVFWKFFKGTKYVHPRDLDIFAQGLKQQMDDECRVWEGESAKEAERERIQGLNVLHRAWIKLWG